MNPETRIFDLCDKIAPSFLNVNAVATKYRETEEVEIDLDQIRLVYDQLIADGFLKEHPHKKGIYHLTVEGRLFIINGGYKARREREDQMIKKLKYDAKNSERVYTTYWITFCLAILGFLISVILLTLKLTE